ncbi:BnaC05g12830D [Brassica napus]|uniref:(rape) hypothetical protein n=1 Tax=Brassica napus TaxID=3708 RepID=A0A078HQF4_BRANA|nr:unnamed protein product [Brassica napus]CDY40032.1 BnaC05g12830D [Brassica napus]
MWEKKDSGKSERDGEGDRIADKRDACVSPLCQLKRDSSLVSLSFFYLPSPFLVFYFAIKTFFKWWVPVDPLEWQYHRLQHVTSLHA